MPEKSNSNLQNWTYDHIFGQDQKRAGELRTIIVIIITTSMMIIEITTGLVFGSMALTINAFAYIYARRHAHDTRYSFGTGKVNALGGFAGALLLAIFALIMVWESVE